MPALGVTEERRALGSNRLHNGPNVVHSLFQGGEILEWHGVGEPGPTLVGQAQSGERCEPFDEPRVLGLFLHLLDVGHPAGHVNQVERSLPYNLIGDVDAVVRLRIAGFGG